MRYDRGIFCKTYAITIGIESFQKEIIINHERICLQLWDTVFIIKFRLDKKDVHQFYDHFTLGHVALLLSIVSLNYWKGLWKAILGKLGSIRQGRFLLLL